MCNQTPNLLRTFVRFEFLYEYYIQRSDGSGLAESSLVDNIQIAWGISRPLTRDVMISIFFNVFPLQLKMISSWFFS